MAINHRAGGRAVPVEMDIAEIPLGRWGEVSDVARAVAWVASEQAQSVVGATLFVDGGMTLSPGFV